MFLASSLEFCLPIFSSHPHPFFKEGGANGDMDFPGGSDGKEPACHAGDPGSIPGSGRSPGERNGYPLQYSCLENSTDRESCWDIVNGVAKSQTQLSN